MNIKSTPNVSLQEDEDKMFSCVAINPLHYLSTSRKQVAVRVCSAMVRKQ